MVRTPANLQLVDSGGQVVMGASTAWPTRESGFGWEVFAPGVELAPDSVYHIESGAQLLSTFRTGTERDSAAPDLMIGELTTRIVGGNEPQFCWKHLYSLDELSLSLDRVGSDVSHVVLDVRVRAGAELLSTLVPYAEIDGTDSIRLTTGECGQAGPELMLDEEYCVSATAYDSAGNSSDTLEACGAATECDPLVEEGRCAKPKGCLGCTATTTNDAAIWLFVLLALGLRGRTRVSSRRRGDLD